MKTTVVEKNGVSVILVESDRIDAHNSEVLKLRMKRLFEEGAKNVLVDLHGVVFIDSSGLGALVSGFKSAMSHKGRLVLAGLREQVKSMVELTRLNRVFEIHATADEAISSLSEGSDSGASPRAVHR